MSAVADRREPGPRVTGTRFVLALASDERLIREMRLGSEAAFEVAYERHSRGLLAMCRHILGSRDDAEEALQHSFAAAWSSIRRADRPGPKLLKPWLYAVARNRCLSILRARQPDTVELDETPSRSGLSEEIEQRADLRELLSDLRELPEEQRTALVLSEFAGLSHADIAGVLDVREAAVKSLVFQARTMLGHWREAREVPCEEIRTQLSMLRGGALRRRELQGHLRTCKNCRDYRASIRAQRSGLAIILPVLPSIALKRGVFSAAGLGGSTGAGVAGLGIGGVGAGTGALVPLGGAAAIAVVGGFAVSGLTDGHSGELSANPPTALGAGAKHGHTAPGGTAHSRSLTQPAASSTRHPSNPLIPGAAGSGASGRFSSAVPRVWGGHRVEINKGIVSQTASGVAWRRPPAARVSGTSGGATRVGGARGIQVGVAGSGVGVKPSDGASGSTGPAGAVSPDGGGSPRTVGRSREGSGGGPDGGGSGRTVGRSHDGSGGSPDGGGSGSPAARTQDGGGGRTGTSVDRSGASGHEGDGGRSHGHGHAVKNARI